MLTLENSSTRQHKNDRVGKHMYIATKVCWTVHVQLKATLCDGHTACRQLMHIIRMCVYVTLLQFQSVFELPSIVHTLTVIQFESKELFQQ